MTAQGAIARLASLQADDGSFGYWTSFDTGNFWLTAYAVDFLQHARTAGLSVPDAMETRATTWLAGKFSSAALEPGDVAGASYAAIVLSRAGPSRSVATALCGGADARCAAERSRSRATRVRADAGR